MRSRFRTHRTSVPSPSILLHVRTLLAQEKRKKKREKSRKRGWKKNEGTGSSPRSPVSRKSKVDFLNGAALQISASPSFSRRGSPLVLCPCGCLFLTDPHLDRDGESGRARKEADFIWMRNARYAHRARSTRDHFPFDPTDAPSSASNFYHSSDILA